VIGPKLPNAVKANLVEQRGKVVNALNLFHMGGADSQFSWLRHHMCGQEVQQVAALVF